MEQLGTPRPLRLGLIGLGNIGQLAHLPATKEANGVELVAVCDARTDVALALAERCGVNAVSPWERLVELDDLDAVLVALPHALHAPVSIAALRAGKHVLCEKPIAGSLVSANAMVRAEGPARLMVAHHKRYDPGCEEARLLVLDGAIGPVRYARYHWTCGDWIAPSPHEVVNGSTPPPPVEQELPPAANTPDLAELAVTLLDMLTHMTNLIAWMVGRPQAVRACQPVQGGIRAHVIYDHGDFLVECIEGPHYPHRGVWDERLEVYGEGGWMVVSIPPNLDPQQVSRVALVRKGAIEERKVAVRWAYTRQVEHFASAIARHTPFTTPAADARDDVRLAEAALAAAVSGRPVPVLW